MKHFLLIAPQTENETKTGVVTLTDEERATLPFSLLSAYRPNSTEPTDIDRCEDSGESETGADHDTAKTIETTETSEMSDAACTVEEPDTDPVRTDDATHANDLTAATDREAIEKTAPSVLFLSDTDEVIARATEKGFATLKLPKRIFPLADTLIALSTEDYDLVVCHVTEPIEGDLLPLFKDRCTLAVGTPADGDEACIYRMLPNREISAPITAEALSQAFFGEDTLPTPLAAGTPTEQPAPISHGIFEWIELFAISLAVVLLIMTFFIRHSPVSGTSMVPTLHGGDVLLLTQIGFTPETGDIVIIQTDKDDLRKPLVKRVIATGGQTVKIDFETWDIYVDGILLDENYLDSTDKSEVMELYSIRQYFTKIDEHHAIYEATVPDGHIFVLGDNRQNSKDSRDLGFIDERHVIGEVIYRLLPFSAMGDPT